MTMAHICPYCHTASEGSASCPECGAPLNLAGSLLVSDADRDQIIGELTDHFQTGRLTKEEFDNRSGQALQARTQAELLGVLADLPPGPTATTAQVGGRRGAFTGEVPAGSIGSQFPARGSRIGIIVLVVIAVLVIGGLHGEHGSLSGLIPVAAIALFVFRRRTGRGSRRGFGVDLGRNDRDLRRDERRLGRDNRRDERDWLYGRASRYNGSLAYCQDDNGDAVQCTNITVGGTTSTYYTDCGQQYESCPTGRLCEHYSYSADWPVTSAEGDGSCGSEADSDANFWSVALGTYTTIELPGSDDTYTLAATAPNDGDNESTGHYYVCYQSLRRLCRMPQRACIGTGKGS